MALLTRTGDQRWETHDGKYYLYGEYLGGHARVRYSIGEHTPQGDVHIEDVLIHEAGISCLHVVPQWLHDNRAFFKI